MTHGEVHVSPYPTLLIRSTDHLVGAYNATAEQDPSLASHLRQSQVWDGQFIWFIYLIKCLFLMCYYIYVYCFLSVSKCMFSWMLSLWSLLISWLPPEQSPNSLDCFVFIFTASFPRELQHLCQGRTRIGNSIAPLSPSACLCCHVGA